MEYSKAIEILRRHNEWRRGAEIPMEEPQVIGDAIDTVVENGCKEQPELTSDIDRAAEDSWAEYEYRESPRGLYSTCYVDGFKAGAEWQREQYGCIPAEESYMRGFAQGAKEERESLSPTMLTYAADVFGGKMLPEDISYSYRQELADYFRDLAKMAKATNARKEENK